MRRLALLLLVAAPAALAQAPYTYIVPVWGSANGFDNYSYTSVNLVNPNADEAKWQVESIYPMRPLTGSVCTFPRVPITLQPHAIYPMRSGCDGLSALVVTSDRPLDVKAEVSFITQPYNLTIEPIDVARAWLPRDSDVVIPLVTLVELSDARANLFVVNPNDAVLTVSVHVDRPEAKDGRDFLVRVEPRSLSLTPVARVAFVRDCPSIPPNPCDPVPANGIHNLTLRADGDFYAGVSNIVARTGAVFRGPILLQP